MNAAEYLETLAREQEPYDQVLLNVAALVRACEAMDSACDLLYGEYHYYQIENQHAEFKSALANLQEGTND